MVLIFPLLALVATTSAAGFHRLCASDRPRQVVEHQETRFKALQGNDHMRSAFISLSKVNTQSGPVIKTYVHVIRNGTTLAGGNVPQEQILAQMDVLNNDYATTPFSFELVNVTYVDNPIWFNQVTRPPSQYNFEMKAMLRQGDAAALNLYLVSFDNLGADGLLGYATFPDMYDDDPLSDGVVLRHTTLPGGPLAPYNLGRTATHEVGHWMGLLHVFQDGCDGLGDQVDDTPAQALPGETCVPADTCPGSPGVDSYRNFLDYSWDSCVTQFTPGQVQRMIQQVDLYRGIVVGDAAASLSASYVPTTLGGETTSQYLGPVQTSDPAYVPAPTHGLRLPSWFGPMNGARR
jgi:hypothetical protein